jgi:hypothetical protein
LSMTVDFLGVTVYDLLASHPSTREVLKNRPQNRALL